ncbi:putative glycerol dehydrogenase [Streptococcus ratti FA-1 = DSM 20564]|nr:putative glycerol dehydrogenase [Streptococcus ratti FA-1 = DSM 20564]
MVITTHRSIFSSIRGLLQKHLKKCFWAGIGDGISKTPEVEHAIKEAKKKDSGLSSYRNIG